MPENRTARFASIVAATAALSLVVGVGSGFIAASNNAATTLEPPAPLTVAVTKGPLSSSYVFRGTIGRVNTSSISDLADAGQVVTRVPVVAGQQISEGDVLLEVAERPTLMLVGTIPMYRDLRPGDTGRDVGQVNAALRRLGFSAPDSTVFTAQTSAALRSLYAQAGYSAPNPSSEASESYSQAKSALSSAQLAAASGGGSSSSSISSAARAVDRAERTLVVAQSAASLANASADAEVARTTSAQSSAQNASDVASGRALLAAQGTDPDTAGPITQERRAELERIAAESANELAAAVSAFTLSALSRDTIYLSSASSVQDAYDDVASSNEALASALAAASRDGVISTAATQAISDANMELSAAALAADTPLPKMEIFFLRESAPTVTSVKTEVGNVAEGELLVIGVNELQVRSSISAVDISRLSLGDEVKIDASDKSIETTGSIIQIDQVGTTEASGQVAHEVLIAFDYAEVGDSVIGMNVRLVRETVAGSTETYSVPSSAVRSQLDGATIIDLVKGDETVAVEVTVGITVQGQTEISTLEEVDLDNAMVVLHWDSPPEGDH